MSLSIPVSWIALGVFAAGFACAQAPPPKTIDIGAQEAPLSDEERIDLDKAVRKHNYADEKAVIDRARAEHPMSREMDILAGRLAYLEKNPKDAANALMRADKIKTLGDDDRLTLALALSFSDRLSQGRTEFQNLIKAAPQNAEYPYLLGRAEVNGHHYEDAVAAFSKAIQLAPGMVRAYEDLARAQESLGLADAARETYETGALRNRQNKVHWEWSPLDLGMVLLKADELDGAEKLFQEALQYNPRFGVAHYYMGQLFQKRGKEAEAMSEYKEAVVDQARLREAWLALGRQLTRLWQQQGRSRQGAGDISAKLESEDNARQGRKN